MVQFDETAYLRMAENLAQGMKPFDISGMTDTHYAPLLPMLIVVLNLVFHNFILSGYLVVAIFGALLVVPAYYLTRELIGERVGLMAAALTGLTPFFIGTSEYIYTEMLYIFLLLSAVYFGWVMLARRRLLHGAMAGLTLGLAYLANPSTLFYFVILLVLVPFVALRKGGWQRLLTVAAVFGAVFLLFAVPYIWYLHHELGRWTYSGKFVAGNIYSATYNVPRDNTKDWEKALLPLNDDGTEIKVLLLEQDSNLNNPINFALHFPVQAAKNFVKQLYVLHSKVMQRIFPLWLLPLLGLGLFARGWDRRRAVVIGYLSLMTMPVLLVLSMLTFPRFFMPFIPFGMIFVAIGWRQLEDWGRQTAARIADPERARRWQRLAPWIIGMLVVVPVLAMGAFTLLKQNYSVEYKEAGQWVKDNEGSGHTIMDREFSATYYARGTAVLLPYDSYERTTNYARLKGVDYMIIGRQAINDWRPDLARLTDSDAAAHPEWKLVHSSRPGTGKETYVFQLVK